MLQLSYQKQMMRTHSISSQTLMTHDDLSFPFPSSFSTVQWPTGEHFQAWSSFYTRLLPCLIIIITALANDAACNMLLKEVFLQSCATLSLGENDFSWLCSLTSPPCVLLSVNLIAAKAPSAITQNSCGGGDVEIKSGCCSWLFFVLCY